MILDSTFLIDVLRGADSVEDLISDLDASGAAFVSAVTTMELFEGIHLADPTEREQAAVETLLTDVNELPFDRECAMRAGRISADLTSAGTSVDVADVMIGATALVHERPVVTRNVDHFDRIEGIEVISY